MMMKKTSISILVFLMLIVPVFSFGQTVVDNDTPDKAFESGKSLVPCGHAEAGKIANPCSFKDVMNLINGIINLILFKLVVPIAAVMFFYAGFKMVTSGGSAEAKTTAKNVFVNAVIGLAVAALAWLIVKMILSIVSPEGTWTWIGF